MRLGDLVRWGVRRLPRFVEARARMAEIEAMRTWETSRRRAFQLDRINRIWDRARRDSPHYAELARRLKLPDRFDSLTDYTARMPLLSREDLRTGRRRLLGQSPEPGFWCQTGGSTGEPTLIYKDHLAHRWSLATQYAHRMRLGVDLFEPLAMIWGHSASFAPGWAGWLQRLKVPLQDAGMNRLRLSAYDLSPAALADYLDRLAAFQPRLIYGYARALYQVVLALNQARMTWPGLRAMVSTSEPLPEPWIDRIHQMTGLAPAQEYGSMECGVMATSEPGGPLDLEEQVVFVETLPIAEGRYEIVVTSLWNQSLPLLRYRIGDVVEAPLSEVERGNRRLGFVQGRANDLLIGGDGRVVHSELVTHILKPYGEGIACFRAVQGEEGAVTVYVQPNGTATPPWAALKNRFEACLNRPVEVISVDAMPRLSGAGKHRWIISHYRTPESAEQRLP